MDIQNRIELHVLAYETLASQVPPFRITPNEHKDFLKFLDSTFGLTDKQKNGLVKDFMGCSFELVQPIEEYTI